MISHTEVLISDGCLNLLHQRPVLSQASTEFSCRQSLRQALPLSCFKRRLHNATDPNSPGALRFCAPPPPCGLPRVPHHRYLVPTWTHLANGEGSCRPPCGPNTEPCNRESPGAPLARPTKEKEGEVERERQAKEREEGHRVVRGRWAPPPMEGKGPREVAMGQWAPRRQLQTKTHHGVIPSPPPPPAKTYEH